MLLGLVGAGFSRELGFFVRPDPPLLLEIREDIRHYDDLDQWPEGKGEFNNAGFVPSVSGSFVESGWALPPQTEGALRYVLPDVPGARSVLVRLVFFHRSPEAKTRVLVFREGDAAPRLAFDNVYFADARLDLSAALSGPGGRVVLACEGQNPTQAPDVFLQYFEVRFFAEPLPALPAIPRMALACLALGLCLLPLVSWRSLLPLWAIVTVGATLRYYALMRVLWLPLDWDTVGYHHLAAKMSLFTDTGFFSAQFGMREPFFVLIVKAVLMLLGDSETHVRLVSFFASLLVIGLTYRLGTRLFGPLLGLTGAAVMAVNLPLVRESVRGLRLEVELILLLLLVEVLFVHPARSRTSGVGNLRAPWPRIVLAGVLAGLLTLTRSTYLVPLMPVLVFGAWRCVPRRAWLAAGLALCLMVGLQLPHRWNMYRLHGNAFQDVSHYPHWFMNAELAGQQPSFREKRDMWRIAGEGSGLTYGDYLFKLHTIPEVIVGTARGFWKMIRHMEVIAFHREVARRTGLHLGWVDASFQVAGMIGLLLAVVHAAFRWMPLLFAVLLLPLAFLYDRGVIESWRLVYQAFPCMLFSVLLVLWRWRRVT